MSEIFRSGCLKVRRTAVGVVIEHTSGLSISIPDGVARGMAEAILADARQAAAPAKKVAPFSPHLASAGVPHACLDDLEGGGPPPGLLNAHPVWGALDHLLPESVNHDPDVRNAVQATLGRAGPAPQTEDVLRELVVALHAKKVELGRALSVARTPPRVVFRIFARGVEIEESLGRRATPDTHEDAWTVDATERAEADRIQAVAERRGWRFTVSGDLDALPAMIAHAEVSRVADVRESFERAVQAWARGEFDRR